MKTKHINFEGQEVETNMQGVGISYYVPGNLLQVECPFCSAIKDVEHSDITYDSEQWSNAFNCNEYQQEFIWNKKNVT